MSELERLQLLVQVIEQDLELISHRLDSVLSSCNVDNDSEALKSVISEVASIKDGFSYLSSEQLKNIEMDQECRQTLDKRLDNLDQKLSNMKSLLAMPSNSV